jgi:hypothetical protein
MSKNWMMLSYMLFLLSAGTSQAHPLDSPDIVYIDGVPCNSGCQSYMAWSRQTLSMNGHSAQRSVNASIHSVKGMQADRSKPAARARLAKQAVPLPPARFAEPPAKIAEPPAKIAEPPARIAELQPAGNAAVASEPAKASVAVPPAASNAAASSNARTIQEQVAAATALAEHVTEATAAPAPQPNANNSEASGRTEAVEPGDTDKTASVPVPPNNMDLLVALVMARPETKSVSDLAGKNIAIENKQSASSGSVRTAIAAAGAAEAQLSEGDAKAIDRLISGEVPAAILTLVSPEAAEWFPDIKGFRIFRIPLSPRSLKARL